MISRKKKSSLVWRTWFVRYFPMDKLWELSQFDKEPTRDKYPWYPAFVEDVAKNGLSSPILIFVGTKQSPQFVVRPGGTRLHACRQLGWKYVPAIVCGHAIPLGLDGYELYTWDEVQALISDGRFVNTKNICNIRQTVKPETGTYPAAKVRYFDKED